ncbi:DUF4221 family protein [Cyclobacterium amurskyense]|uniref:DUF4221 domain-containing protein n=1 Tax=Cyclobacterium amurskyense TaxID=320787 RepID=A0A0H4P6X0_9BACT|nr:DUF4221 family protein [Cyclobacterium amurskyense]AKP49914.1 hypothetical protein CA2015_0444 [Cyclobacterium amurskyense]
MLIFTNNLSENRNVFIIFLLLFYSCQGEAENKLLEVIKVKELKIKPEVLTIPNPPYVHLIESDSGQYLFYLNPNSKSLQFMNMEDGKVANEIILEYDGPNSMSRRSGIAGLENDKVWTTFRPHAIAYFNYKAEIQFKKDIPSGEVDITYVGSSFQKGLHQYGDKVFGMQPLFMNHHGMNKDDIQKHSLVYSYDMVSDQTKWYDVYYAKDYWDSGKKLSNFSWVRREDKLYIAPWYDHEIQVFDMQKEQVTIKVEAKSDHINSFYYVNEIPGTHEEGLLNILNNDLYGIILYDKYRDCFYRFFYPGFTDDEEYAIDKLWMLRNSRPFTGVMVLDKDLNIIGEHIFDKFQVHASSNVFVGEEGLYLSLNNENSPDYDEDHLRYMVVQFEVGE